MAKSGNFCKYSKRLQKMCAGLDWKRVWCEERHCKNCQHCHWHWLTCLGLMVMLRFGLREILHHILSLTKIQCQRSINSSASIMIVQLPWKGVDKLISIVDVLVIAPFLVSLSQYYFMIVNFLDVNPLLSDGDV